MSCALRTFLHRGLPGVLSRESEFVAHNTQRQHCFPLRQAQKFSFKNVLQIFRPPEMTTRGRGNIAGVVFQNNLTLSLPSSKRTLSQPPKEECISAVVRIESPMIFYLSQADEEPSSSYRVMLYFWRGCRGNLTNITLGSERVKHNATSNRDVDATLAVNRNVVAAGHPRRKKVPFNVQRRTTWSYQHHPRHLPRPSPPRTMMTYTCRDLTSRCFLIIAPTECLFYVSNILLTGEYCV